MNIGYFVPLEQEQRRVYYKILPLSNHSIKCCSSQVYIR